MELPTQAPPRVKPPEPGRTIVLAARGVKKSFEIGKEGRLEVLRGVDLEVARGEAVAIVGRSGGGKSTLLHLLGLLDRPTAGTVEVCGVETTSASRSVRDRLRRERIGFVFQFYHLLPDLDALENVLLPAMIAHSRLGFGAKKRELRDRARGLLERFGLGARLRHRPSQLSGGERQRVAMARALFLDPPILLADEPTGNLDSATGAAVLELLLEEQRRRSLSMILVTHDEKIAHRCERVVQMKDGRIV